MRMEILAIVCSAAGHKISNLRTCAPKLEFTLVTDFLLKF
jgi:hypothetical protein